MLELRQLVIGDEKTFRAAISEFETKDKGFTFAFQFDKDSAFADYLSLVHDWSLGKNIGPFVANTFLVGVVDGKIVGRVSLRHTLNKSLECDGGHIGYGVVPSERRKGYAKDMLRQALPIARSLGLQRVLLTCDDDNRASARTIEANGGRLQDRIPSDAGLKRRYWIDL
jgi:predicted acetyltransferase